MSNDHTALEVNEFDKNNGESNKDRPKTIDKLSDYGQPTIFEMTDYDMIDMIDKLSDGKQRKRIIKTHNDKPVIDEDNIDEFKINQSVDNPHNGKTCTM